MKRMARAFCVLAFAVAVTGSLVAGGTPSADSVSVSAVQALPSDPSWDSAPVDLGA